jgi:hypothetical protein
MIFALQTNMKNDYSAEREEEPKRIEEQWRNKGRDKNGDSGETLMG